MDNGEPSRLPTPKGEQKKPNRYISHAKNVKGDGEVE